MHENNNNIYVLIVAAGCSRRMKQFKPLLPLGKGCILESTIRNFLNADLSNLIVVVGYRRQSLLPLLHKYNATVVVNEGYDDTDMLESIKLGLSALPPSAEAVFLCPGDVPLISPFTIRELLKQFRQSPFGVLIPTYHKESGHPPLFTRAVADAILNYKGDSGVRGALEQFRENTLYLEVPDPEILKDTDLPKDYERLKEAYRNREIPSLTVCEDIWNYVNTPPQVRAHCAKVSETALCLLEEVRKRFGISLQEDLLSRSALLHDMLRSQPRHDQAAARLLEEMGYRKIGYLAGCHKHLPSKYKDTVNEAVLLYLADRLVLEDQNVTLKQRYEDKARRLKDYPAALEFLEEDRKTAEALYAKIRGEAF